MKADELVLHVAFMNGIGFMIELFPDGKLPPKDIVRTSLANMLCETMTDKEGNLELKEDQEAFIDFFLKAEADVWKMEHIKFIFLGDATLYVGENFGGMWLAEDKTPIFLSIPDKGG